MLRKVVEFPVKIQIKGGKPLTILEFEQELYEAYDLMIDYALEQGSTELLEHAARSLQAHILKYKLIHNQYIKEIQQLRHPKIKVDPLPTISGTPNPDDPDDNHGA